MADHHFHFDEVFTIETCRPSASLPSQLAVRHAHAVVDQIHAPERDLPVVSTDHDFVATRSDEVGT
jgi:hypothetical protein